MSSELHIDMLFMRWRESGIYGNMVLRGTAGVVLGTFRPLSAAHNIAGNTYYCLNLVRPGVHPTPQTMVAGGNHTIKHAKSLRVDTRQHPRISVFYNAGLSNTEKWISEIDITHNYLLFERGIFADAQIQTDGCGALVVCSNTRSDVQSPSSHRPIRLVDWRLCKTSVHLFLQATHKTATALSSQRQTNVHPQCGPHQTWDFSLYNIFQQKIKSTFNLGGGEPGGQAVPPPKSHALPTARPPGSHV